jgi:hypothetical protein
VNGHLFCEIKFHARINLSIFSIKYCPRAYNKVADALAMYGTKLGARFSGQRFGRAHRLRLLIVESNLE